MAAHLSPGTGSLFDAPTDGPGDHHAHVFAANVAGTPNPRYVPDYDATVAEYFAQLDMHGLSWGTLVQPSFLGTDNSMLLAALADHPDRLRGVAVLDGEDPRRTCPDIADWHARGVRGVRLNLLGSTGPDLSRPAWQTFLDDMAAHGWHLELQIPPEAWATWVPILADVPCRVVIDHLGLPESVDSVPGHPLFALAVLPHVWVKASGSYRCGPGAARAMYEALCSAGTDRLVPGSDWPHTRFEGRATGAWEFFGAGEFFDAGE